MSYFYLKKNKSRFDEPKPHEVCTWMEMSSLSLIIHGSSGLLKRQTQLDVALPRSSSSNMESLISAN
jgi:hypothetical protein